jgi:FkbM family methyltransferase
VSAPMRFVRRVHDAARRRSPFERAIPHTSMAALSRRARTEIRAFQVRCALPLLPTAGYGRVTAAAGCAVYVHADTLAIDVVTLDYVWRRDLFPVDVGGRVVLDLGAHKGYYGALAMFDGATAVVSFEPESVNHGALVRATVAGRDRDDWTRHRAAVGATAGEVTLSVSTESWSHSIHAPASGDIVRTERVPMVAFADVLADAFANHPDRPVVLKLNVEGAAGDCLLSVPAGTLGRLEVLLVDLEANTPQPLDDILGHIEAAGFELAGERELVYHFVRKGSR